MNRFRLVTLVAVLFAWSLAACEDMFPKPPGQSSAKKKKKKGAGTPSDSHDDDDDDDDDEPAGRGGTKPKKKADPKPISIPTKISVINGMVELGVVPYPNGTPLEHPADFKFNVISFSPAKHHVGYRLSDEEASAVKSFYKDFAKSVGFKRIDEKTFSWNPPPGCPRDISCIYGKLVKRTRPDIAIVAKRFLDRAHDQSLTSLQTAEMMLSFVQAIPYELPDDPFGVKPPPAVVAERRGDCDSKALVLFLMLEAAGIDSVLIGSTAHAHTMVGIALPAGGKSFEWKGRKYAFAEVTAIGSPIGHINPPLQTPNDWRVEFSGK